jgi:transposase
MAFVLMYSMEGLRMKAYSMDLRERVVAAAEEGVMSHEEIADTFQVSVSWIGKLLKRFRETGSVAPEPHRGGQPGAFQGEAAERLVQAVKDNPDATLKQLALIAGVSCSTSATDRMLRKLGITRKKSRYVLPNRTGPTSKPNELSGTKN